ncbi:ribonuclease E inhibitor RraA/Dimethylmenaquinone methyltransferase, partial [Staphylotrichum tortipilum]
LIRAQLLPCRCDVADALVKLSIPHGNFLPGITLWSPERQAGETKIVGPAYTVLYVPLGDERGKWGGGHYIDSVPAGAVVLVSCRPATSNALYGGLMSTRARASGAIGTVVDGRFRDVQEQRDLGYPVFARDVGTTPPGPLFKVVAVNEPVTVPNDGEGVVVNPGDYLIGDANGVVVLPKGLAEQALPLMAKQVAADSQMAVAIQEGMTFSEASKRFRL